MPGACQPRLITATAVPYSISGTRALGQLGGGCITAMIRLSEVGCGDDDDDDFVLNDKLCFKDDVDDLHTEL